MFKTKLSELGASKEFYTSKLADRHIGAIAVLILISLLSSLSGTPAIHAISNSWEGFLWGVADPVIRLDCLVGIVAIGLLSAIFVRGALVIASFALAAVLGIVIHLFQVNFPGTEIALAISTIVLSIMLIVPTQANFVILALMGASVGLFQGYAVSQSIIQSQIIPLFTYILGMALTQLAVTLSVREIGAAMGMAEINRVSTWKISVAGFCLFAMAIAFFSNSII
ncbi:MAG: HupE/UreJ family protein [Nostoc sp. ChiSLP02]|nr:HupE/UreJ family protein [Nostoc sp. DedSLP05]MDZ8103243.1 HupE/UreJ family protein [Nostoc sp. DedSLP01]MDZ8188006.1 HupE/UreJ family protein [Nostoc sp. ChiSLP02]